MGNIILSVVQGIVLVWTVLASIKVSVGPFGLIVASLAASFMGDYFKKFEQQRQLQVLAVAFIFQAAVISVSWLLTVWLWGFDTALTGMF